MDLKYLESLQQGTKKVKVKGNEEEALKREEAAIARDLKRNEVTIDFLLSLQQ